MVYINRNQKLLEVASRINYGSCHACLPIHFGGYFDHRQELFGPSVSLITSVLSLPTYYVGSFSLNS